MKAAIISFTKNGSNTAKEIRRVLEADGWQVSETVKCAGIQDSYTGKLRDWTKEHFYESDALIYVGATGIAVRAIAPFLVSKKEDPAVLVIDEQGKYCIPILSGHIGGANQLADRLGERLSMEAVITTATDLNQKWAVDVFAKKNRLFIENMRLAKMVSSDILAGNCVNIEWEPEGSLTGIIPGELRMLQDAANHSEQTHVSRNVKIHIGVRKKAGPAGLNETTKTERQPEVLHLVPKALILGIGCKKGTLAESIERRVTEVFAASGLLPQAVKLVASIDLKKEEPGLCEYCAKHGLPFQTFSKEELEQAEGTFSGSEFVKRTTGVDNVCERSAICAGGEKILVHKTAKDGVTVAVAIKKWSVNFE